MKTNRLTRHAMSWLLLMMTIIISSCSSDRNRLLESVPFDSEFAGTVNLVELGSKSGFSIENGSITLPTVLKSLKDKLSPADLRKAADWMQAIDMENIVIFGSIRRQETCATALVKDADRLRSLLKSMDLERSVESDYEIYSAGRYGPCFAINEDEMQMWIFPTQSQTNRLDEFKFARKKNNILRYSGLADALTAGNIINCVVDISALGNTVTEEYWAATALDVTNNAIVATSTVITADGKTYHTDALQPVAPDFLRYMPANFIFATAFGLRPDSGWFKALEETMMYLGDAQTNSMLGEAAPFLKAIDGTVAFGFGPKNKAALMDPDTPESWQALLMARMPQSKVNELTEIVRSNLPGSTEAGNGRYEFRSRDYTVSYGMVDGYFGIGLGMELKPDKQNSFTNDFNGKPFGLVFQTPVLSTLVDKPTLDFSIKATMELNNDKCRLQINLVGSDRPVIPTLISSIPEFLDAYSQKVRES